MNLKTKALMATTGAAMLALGAASPASAQYYGHHRGYDRGDRIDWQVRDRGWQMSRRDGIDQCRAAVARTASRHGNARVTDIDRVDMTRDGVRVRGDVAVYERDWRGNARYDRGTFTCRVDDGRVVDLDFHGIRGM